MQSLEDVKDKFFVIYLDILGFGIPRREDAEKLYTTDDKLKQMWLDDVDKHLEDAKNNSHIRSFYKISLDSWVAFSESPNNIYNFLKFIFTTRLQFEIALDFKAFPNADALTLTDEMMAFLKNNIIGDYRRFNKTKLTKTFILTTEDAYLALGKDECWQKLYPEAKYHYFIKHEGKKKDTFLDTVSIKKKIVEAESRISAKPIFGRENDIATICNIINCHSLAIIGIKGIGKSKITSAVFERLIENNSYETYYWRRFTYNAPPTFADFGRRFVRDIINEDIDFDHMEVRDQVQLVVRVMKEKHCLHVIDQFEAVIDKETGMLKDKGFAELLTHANEGLDNARILITAWELPKDSRGMPFPIMLLKGIDKTSGTNLINDLKGIENDQKIPQDTLEKIVAGLAGHPLALSAITSYSINELEQMLSDQALWEGTIIEIVSRIVSKTYERLPQKQKQVLSCASIFLKAFDVNGISFVADMPPKDTFPALNDLRQRGLIMDLQERKYEVHILVKEFVLNQLEQLPEEKQYLHSKAAEFYLTRPISSPKERKSIDDVRTLLDAIDHLIYAEKYERASRLFIEQELDEQLYCWSHFLELVDIYNRFIEKDIPKDILSVFLGNLGLVYRDLEELNKAKKYYEKALIISRECQNRMSECMQFVNLGDVFHFLGQLNESIGFHNRAKNLIEELKNDNSLISKVKLRGLEGRNIGCLGNAIRGKGDLQKAKEYYEQAITTSKEICNKRYEGIWLGDLGNIYADEDNFSKAIETYRAAHKIAQEIGDRRHESWWLGVIGQTYIKMNDFQKAKDCLEHALSISEKIIYRRGISSQLHTLGGIYISTGEFLKAVDCFEKLISLTKEIKETDKDRKQERLYLKAIGDTYFAHGEYIKSISYYEKVLDIDKEVNDRKQEIFHLSNLGDQYAELKQFEKAIEHYQLALDINNLCGDKQSEVILLDRLEKAYLESGQYEKAKDLFTQAQNIIGEQFTTFITQFQKTIASFENELFNARSSGDRKQEMVALSNLGSIYLKSDQKEKAIEYYRLASNIAKELSDWPKESEFLSNVGDIFSSLNQFMKATTYYEKVIKINPKFVNAQIKLGDIYKKLGREKDAKFFGKGIKAFSNVINIEPTNSSAFMGRATCHALKGNLENAISDYETAFKFDPSNTGAILSKMEVEIWLGRYSNARSTYGKCHKNFSSSTDRIVAAWLICTSLALDGMPYDDYIEPLRNYDITLPEGEWGTSDIEIYFDRLSKAALPSDRLAKALEIHALFKNHFKKTEEIMKEIETDLFRIEPLLFEAEAYLSQGNFEKSLEKCNEAITLAANSAKAYILKGKIYKAFQEPGNYLDLAIQDFTKAIELDPQNSLAFNKRADCYAYKDKGNLDEEILDKALSDYRESIRLASNNITAIISKMEIEIWLGRYSEARNTFKKYRLDQTAMSPQYRLMASWLMCLALSLDGMPYEDYIFLLTDGLVIISREDYNPEDIEPYLAKLKKSSIPIDRLNNALKINALFLKHYREEIKYLI